MAEYGVVLGVDFPANVFLHPTIIHNRINDTLERFCLMGLDGTKLFMSYKLLGETYDKARSDAIGIASRIVKILKIPAEINFNYHTVLSDNGFLFILTAKVRD